MSDAGAAGRARPGPRAELVGGLAAQSRGLDFERGEGTGQCVCRVPSPGGSSTLAQDSGPRVCVRNLSHALSWEAVSSGAGTSGIPDHSALGLGKSENPKAGVRRGRVFRSGFMSRWWVYVFRWFLRFRSGMRDLQTSEELCVFVCLFFSLISSSAKR